MSRTQSLRPRRDWHPDMRLTSRSARVSTVLHMPTSFQDMCSRITLDSATSFLFNHDVASLSAGLIYPPGTPEAVNQDRAHPSNAFAHAFSAAQHRIAFRTFLGVVWPLTELTGDKTKEDMSIVNAYIEPIIEEAIRIKHEGKVAEVDEKTVEGYKSLLDYLLSVTEGACLPSFRMRVTELTCAFRPCRYQGRNTQHHDRWSRHSQLLSCCHC